MKTRGKMRFVKWEGESIIGCKNIKDSRTHEPRNSGRRS
jgi:hypothetical protein